MVFRTGKKTGTEGSCPFGWRIFVTAIVPGGVEKTFSDDGNSGTIFLNGENSIY
jgi:hypothetical protein